MSDATTKSSIFDPTLYLYTSLTAGSSHIITATSRLETILKANKIPFQAIDVATDEKARMLWGRRSKGKKLPGLVKHGTVLADLPQIEEWNEYGELRDQIGNVPVAATTPSASHTSTPTKPSAVGAAGSANMPTTTSTSTFTTSIVAASSPKPGSTSPHVTIRDLPGRESVTPKSEEERITLALRQAGAEAAGKAKDNTKAKLGTKVTSRSSSSETRGPQSQVPGTSSAKADEIASQDPAEAVAESTERLTVKDEETFRGKEAAKQPGGAAPVPEVVESADLVKPRPEDEAHPAGEKRDPAPEGLPSTE